MQLLSKVRSRILSGVQSELDNEYHKLISDEEFKEYGHIYYNLEERYENIKKSK